MKEVQIAIKLLEKGDVVKTPKGLMIVVEDESLDNEDYGILKLSNNEKIITMRREFVFVESTKQEIKLAAKN